MSETSEKETRIYFAPIVVICFALYLFFVWITLSPVLGFIPKESIIFACIFTFLITAYSLTENWFKKRGSSFFYIRDSLKFFLCFLLFCFLLSIDVMSSLSKATRNAAESIYNSLETGKRIHYLYVPDHVHFFSVHSNDCVKMSFFRGHETVTVQTREKEWEEQKIKKDEFPLWLAKNFYQIKDCGELFILISNYPMGESFKVKYSSDGRIISIEKP